MKRKQKNEPFKLRDLIILFFGLISLYYGGSVLVLGFYDLLGLNFWWAYIMVWCAPVVLVVVVNTIVQGMVKETWRSILISTIISIILGFVVVYEMFFRHDIAAQGRLFLLATIFLMIYGPGFFAINYFTARIRKYLLNR